MIAVVLALLAAACNAIASVLQRRAARTAPASEAFRLALILDLIRRPQWLGGIVALTAGFVLQASALSFGELSLVQPLLVTELPFTMIVIGWAFRIRLGRDVWVPVATLTAGLAILLIAAGPSGGKRFPGPADWLIVTAVTAGILIWLVSLAKLRKGSSRAVLLGIAAGLGFAFTAALMKENTDELAKDPLALLSTWQLYAMVAAGLGSLFLLQNAFQSGALVAVQPALTISDPVASIGYGVALFGEDIRLGMWVVPELLGIGLIMYGSVKLAQSGPIRAHTELTPPQE